ncbi:MAG: hypothetical protein EBZ48_08585, partial [Proteobacteria bacterium]|nr:hypothetical protein [Pseudomonadota bacterium]
MNFDSRSRTLLFWGKAFSVAYFSLVVMLQAGCSKTSTTSNSVTAAAAAISGAQEKLALLAAAPGGDVSRDNAFDWNGSGILSDPRNSGEPGCEYNVSVNPKTRIQIDFTETAARCNGSAVNVFGKIKHTMQVICAIS